MSDRAIQRAEQAKMILDSDAYQAAWKDIHATLLLSLLDCPDDDDKARYCAWQALRIMSRLEVSFKNMIQTGDSAKNAITREVERQEKINNRTIRVV